MPYVQIDQTRMFYAEAGEGEPVVFLHEYFGTHESWRKQTGVIDRDYRTLTVDQRGHGRTPHPGGRLRITDIAADTQALICKLDIAPVHLVGSSLGALAGLVLARECPHLVQTLTVISPPQLSEPATLAYARHFVNEVYPADPDRWERGHENQPAGHVRSVLIHNFALDEAHPPEDMIIAVDRAREIRCPTLVVAGDNDGVFTIHRAVALAESITDAELCILPRAGHSPHRTMPDAFNAILLNFLKRFPGNDGGSPLPRR